MSLMFQTFRPGRGLSAKAFLFLQKWSKASSKSKENIVKEVLGDSSKQPGPQIKDKRA
jgi:hypothetical protein